MKRFGKIFISTIFIHFAAIGGLFAQGAINPPNLEPISLAVVSPNAASLGNYVEIPVSNYSGIPSIGLPLWDITFGDIHIPLTLTYHAGGIKVEEIASWAGLGWSLNGGGVISRSVRNNIDELEFSYARIKRYVGDSMDLPEKADFLDDLVYGRIDTEPDIYTINVNGIMCQFYQNSNGEFMTLPLDLNIKIERLSVNNWRVTDSKGIRYTFSEVERNETSDVGGQSSTAIVTSWYLTRIEDIKGNIINYTYTEELYNYKNKAVERINNPSVECAGGRFVGRVTENSFSSPRLVKISYGRTEIILDAASVERQDLAGGHALKYLKVYHQDSLIKKYQFFTSFFSNDLAGINSTRYYTYTSSDGYRLRLDSVREESSSKNLPPHKFSYLIRNGLPHRLSNAQDHWGYYNGKTGNYDFVPYMDLGIDGQFGGDRNIDPNYSDEFTLIRIDYPTGGYKTFDFESNSVAPTGEPYTVKDFVTLLGDNTIHRPGDDKDEFITTMELDLTDYSSYEEIIIKSSYETPENGPNCDCSFDFFLLKDGEDPIQLLQNGQYQIPVDTYTLMGRITQPHDGPGLRDPASFSLTLNGYVIDSTAYKQRALAPGIRIKKIQNVDASGITHTKLFDYNNPNTGVSSGTIANFPHYEVAKAIGSDNTGDCRFTQYSTYSNYPLLNAKSAHTGYSYVTEYNDEGGNLGKKISRYTNFYEYSDLNMTSEFPFKPHTSQAWKRGLPLEESYFEFTGSGYAIKKKSYFRYSVLTNTSHSDYGVKGGFLYLPPNEALMLDHVKVEAYKGDPYEIRTDAFKLELDSIVTYSGTDYLQVTNEYEYSTVYFQFNKKSTTESNQTFTTVEIKYPYDINVGDDPNGIYQGMVSANMLDYPLEVKKIQNNTLVAINNVDYYAPYSGMYMPAAYKSWNFESESYEMDQQFPVYTSNGKPIEEIKNGITIVHLWGYQGQYPVAKIIGTNWGDIVTKIDTSILNSGTSAQILSQLSNLRSSYSSNPLVQISTYLYKPQIGMISETGPSGRTIYYEYDVFNRLRLIKNQDGNILKRFYYQYNGETDEDIQ